MSQQLGTAKGTQRRIVVGLDSPMQNPGAIPFILAAEAALLVVRLGASDCRSVRSIIEIVGRERVLGAFVVH